jgi:hypothetical protein
MQISRMYCSRCETSIYNVLVDGLRVPLVLYFVVGQPEDTGPALDVNGDGVRLPAFVREIMHDHVRIKRAELCMNCVAEIFGTPLVTAADDDMYSVEQVAETRVAVQALDDPAIAQVTRSAAALDRVFQGILVGRGAEVAPALPEPAPVARFTDPTRLPDPVDPVA